MTRFTPNSRRKHGVGAQRAPLDRRTLRECGIAWSSGVVALATASHLKELTALFALLSLRGKGAEVCAVHLAAACAVLRRVPQ